MTSQKLSLSQTEIPEKFREKFLIKRIDEDDIEITLEQRDNILKALNAGTRFVQIGRYTIMLNAIKSIDPKWGKANIPPRPEERTRTLEKAGSKPTVYISETINKDEIDIWDALFGTRIEENEKNLTDDGRFLLNLPIADEDGIKSMKDKILEKTKYLIRKDLSEK